MSARLKPEQRNLAPQLEKQRKWRRTIVVGAVWVAIVFGAALFETKPALREISFWRARRYAAKAEVDLGAENWQSAQTKALMAYQIQPQEPSALRAVARLQSLTGNSTGALQFWTLLEATGKLTDADRRLETEDYLRAGMQQEARKQVERLLADGPNDPQNLRVAAKWAATEKNSEAAINFASRAQAVEPTNLPGQLLLGLLQAEAPAYAVKQSGIQTLLRLADDKSRTGLEALIFLSTRKELPPAQAPLVIDRLRAHPLASEGHRLLALDLELSLKPNERNAVLDAAMERYKNANPDAQRAFGVWLNSHQEYTRTLALLPLTEAMKRKDFLLITLDAMAQQKRWTEIEEILGDKAVPLDEVYTELFLARSAMELGQQSSADLHWRRAHLAAGASFEQMKFLAAYAEKIGQTDHAELAYRSLTNSAATARDAYESLLRLAEKRHDTQGVRDLLGEMLKRWPTDAAVRNDYTYFTLLRYEDLTESLKTARELVALAPTSLAHRTTLALANLRLNDPGAALAVYTGLNVPWDKAPASHRAVYAAVLGMNGKADEARAQAAKIPNDALGAEERELIAPWRAR